MIATIAAITIILMIVMRAITNTSVTIAITVIIIIMAIIAIIVIKATIVIIATIVSRIKIAQKTLITI